MIKSICSSESDLSNSILIISLPSQGNTSQFALSLLLSNNEFKSIGYLYSENINKSIGYSSSNNDELIYNGQIFFNASKKITILNLCKGIIKKKMNLFIKELLEFIKKYNFKQIQFFSGISKAFITDVDILSKEVNIYHFTNDASFTNNYGLKSIKEAFKIDEANRNGKIYKEMECVEGCDSTRIIIQHLILNKINFLFIFGFSEKFFDPFCAFALYNKMSIILGLIDKENIMMKSEKNQKDVLDDILKYAKFDNIWNIVIKE